MRRTDSVKTLAIGTGLQELSRAMGTGHCRRHLIIGSPGIRDYSTVLTHVTVVIILENYKEKNEYLLIFSSEKIINFLFQHDLST